MRIGSARKTNLFTNQYFLIMKKITLLLSMLLCMASVSFAQKSVRLDFAALDSTQTAQAAIPIEEAATADTQCTLDGYTFTINNACWKKPNYGNPAYLMVYPNGYINLPVVDFKVGKITIKTGKGAGTSVQVKLMSGETLIEEKALDAKDTEFTWTLTGQEAGATYQLLTSKKNAQYQYIIMEEASAAGTLSFKDAGDVAFGVVVGGSQTNDVEVVADGLSSDIAVAVEGEGFTVDQTTLPATGGILKVTYTGNAAGATANGTLSLTSGSLTATTNLTAATAQHAGTLQDPFSPADVTMLCGKTGETEYWVSSVIAGCADNGGKLLIDKDTKAPKYVATNLALVGNDSTTYIPVELKGDIRPDLNLVDNPTLLNTTIWVKGQLMTYFGVAGVKNLKGYSLDGINVWSGVESVKAVSHKVYAVNGYIKTTGNNETVSVYNVTGKLVATGKAGRDIKVAAKGIYIVKVGEKATKVVVR